MGELHFSFRAYDVINNSNAKACQLSPHLRRPPVAHRPETLKTERSGTVAQCGESEADWGSLDGKSGDVRTDEWKTKGVVRRW